MGARARTGTAGLCLVCLIAGNCGGGGGGGTNEQSVVLSVDDGTWDGTLRSDVALSALSSRVGDIPGVDQRAYCGFRLAGLTTGATIHSAILRLYQDGVEGDPFTKRGDIYVDHVHFPDVPSISYAGGLMEERVALLSSGRTPGWREVDVTDNVRASLALGHERSCFRLRFWREGPAALLDGFIDRVTFEDVENLGGGPYYPPELVVTYTPGE